MVDRRLFRCTPINTVVSTSITVDPPGLNNFVRLRIRGSRRRAGDFTVARIVTLFERYGFSCFSRTVAFPMQSRRCQVIIAIAWSPFPARRWAEMIAFQLVWL